MENERAIIGGNNPPTPIDILADATKEAITAAIENLTARHGDDLSECDNWADGTSVENDVQMHAVDHLIAAIKVAEKDVDLIDGNHVKPIYDTWKFAKAMLEPPRKDLDSLRKILVASVADYKKRLAAEKADAARLAREKADALLAAAQAAPTASIEDVRERNQMVEDARIANAMANKAAKDKVKGLRNVKVAKVTNSKELAAYIWQTDFAAMQAFLDEYARNHMSVKLPGVEIVTEERAF